MKRMLAALAAAALALGTSSCGKPEASSYAREAERAGLGAAVTYESFTAGLPNSEVRALVDASKVDDPDALVGLLQGQKLMFVEVHQPGQEPSKFQPNTVAYIPVLFDAAALGTTLPGTDLRVSGSWLTAKGDVDASVLHEVTPLVERVEHVKLDADPYVDVVEGWDPDRIAEVMELARTASPYKVDEITWNGGVKHLVVIADQRPDVLDSSEFAWVDPFLTSDDPRVIFATPNEKGDPVKRPPNFQLR